MHNKYKRAIIGSLLMLPISVNIAHESKSFDLAKRHNKNNNYGMEISTLREACSFYELCNKQYHIEATSVSAVGISTTTSTTTISTTTTTTLAP